MSLIEYLRNWLEMDQTFFFFLENSSRFGSRGALWLQRASAPRAQMSSAAGKRNCALGFSWPLLLAVPLSIQTELLKLGGRLDSGTPISTGLDAACEAEIPAMALRRCHSRAKVSVLRAWVFKWRILMFLFHFLKDGVVWWKTIKQYGMREAPPPQVWLVRAKNIRLHQVSWWLSVFGCLRRPGTVFFYWGSPISCLKCHGSL